MAKKPPIGIMPEKFWKEQEMQKMLPFTEKAIKERMNGLRGAIMRYERADGFEPNEKWFNEYRCYSQMNCCEKHSKRVLNRLRRSHLMGLRSGIFTKCQSCGKRVDNPVLLNKLANTFKRTAILTLVLECNYCGRIHDYTFGGKN